MPARVGPFFDNLKEARDYLDAYDTAVSDGPFKVIAKANDPEQGNFDRFLRRKNDALEVIYRIRRNAAGNWRLDEGYTLAQANSDRLLELRARRALIRWNLDGTENPTLLPGLPANPLGGLQGELARLNAEITTLQGG